MVCNVSVALECMVMGTADSVMMTSSCAPLCFAGLLPLTSSCSPSSPSPLHFSVSSDLVSVSFLWFLGNSVCAENPVADSELRGKRRKLEGN